MSGDGFTADYRLCPAALFRTHNTRDSLSTAVQTVLALLGQTHCPKQHGRPHELLQLADSDRWSASERQTCPSQHELMLFTVIYYHFPNSVTLRFIEQARIFTQRFPNRYRLDLQNH